MCGVVAVAVVVVVVVVVVVILLLIRHAGLDILPSTTTTPGMFPTPTVNDVLIGPGDK